MPLASAPQLWIPLETFNIELTPFGRFRYGQTRVDSEIVRKSKMAKLVVWWFGVPHSAWAFDAGQELRSDRCEASDW